MTGRFGLGFKSAHLIAREVGIASGFVSCRVRGGMLPTVWDEGRQLSFEVARAGRRATVIDLEIDPDRRRDAEEAFATFRQCAPWLPATARVIRDLQLDGQRFAARYVETSAESICHLTFEGTEAGEALALKLDDDTTLFLLLSSDGPEPLPSGMPRLWLLAPLEEECRSGWLLNSYGFQVDPGRGRLKGSIEERRALFRRFGRALGERLVALYDLAEAEWSGFAATVGILDENPETGRVRFLVKLVRLFAADVAVDVNDDRLEAHLHHEGGLKHLVSERPTLPTGLPRPFAPLLRADEVRWQIAGPLAERSRLTQLGGWRALAAIQQTAVSNEAAELLRRLGFHTPAEFGVAQLVRAELGLDKRTDAVVAARLGRLLDTDLQSDLQASELQALLGVAAEARFQMSDGSWREARLVLRDSPEADDEERQILAFAPESAVADGSYQGASLAFYRFAARQSGFQRTADTFAQWAYDMTGIAERRALLAYVIVGDQGDRLGSLLAKNRPLWIPEMVEDLRNSELLDGLGDDQRGRLLTALYPSLARDIARGTWGTSDPNAEEHDSTPPDPTEVLNRILMWWRADHRKRRLDYDSQILPDGFLPGALRDVDAIDDKVGWFTFFALGMFRTIGWNNEGAHKNFVEGAMRAGWWQEMAEARFPESLISDADLLEAGKPWLRQLESFADARAWRIDFPQWRRTLADLYALARWLPDYVEAFQLLPRVIKAQEQVMLSSLWRISAEPLWQRRGLEGAPLTQSLGLGANWMIREAVRHGFWPEEQAALMHPYGWAATARMRRLFDDHLGHSLGERGSMDLSPAIHAFIKGHLGADTTFLGDLDLPLQLWGGNEFESLASLDEDEEASV